MSEKEIMLEQEEVLATQQAEAEKAEPAENEKISFTLKNIIDDGNDLVYAEMPQTKQQEHLRQMKKAVRAKQVCYGRIYAIEEISDKFLLRILVKKDSLKVIIPASDFFALSDFEGNIESETEEEDLLICLVPQFRLFLFKSVKTLTAFRLLSLQEKQRWKRDRKNISLHRMPRRR